MKPLLYYFLKALVVDAQTYYEDEALIEFAEASPKGRAQILLRMYNGSEGLSVLPGSPNTSCALCDRKGTWRSLIVDLNETRVDLFFCDICENRIDVIEDSTPAMMMNCKGEEGFFTETFLGYMMTMGAHGQTYDKYKEGHHRA